MRRASPGAIVESGHSISKQKKLSADLSAFFCGVIGGVSSFGSGFSELFSRHGDECGSERFCGTHPVFVYVFSEFFLSALRVCAGDGVFA